MGDPPGMQVLLVLATSTGGVGRHVRSVAAGMPSRGVSVSVAGPAATDAMFGFRTAGAHFTAVEIASGPRPVRDARAGLALRRRMRRPPGPDLVHAHGLRAGLIAGLARPAGMPLVLSLHNAVLGAGVRRWPAAGAERLAIRLADVVLAASADLAERAAALGGRDVRLAPVAAPPLPPARRPPTEVRAELGALGRPVLLTVARLHPQKGLDVLIDAAGRLARRQPPPLVAIAGDGPAEAALRALIAASPADVRLLGRRTDIADLLAAADLVLLPSRWEARALIAQEALRAGRPLVATAVGGLPDLLGDAALLVPPEDPGALAAAAAQLLEHPAEAAELAERGRRRAATWPDEASMLDQLAQVYTQLTA